MQWNGRPVCKKAGGQGAGAEAGPGNQCRGEAAAENLQFKEAVGLSLHQIKSLF